MAPLVAPRSDENGLETHQYMETHKNGDRFKSVPI
jgi:hypothetical protein